LKQVLLLDDSPTQLSIREMVLRRAQIECQIVGNAPDAIKILRDEPGNTEIGAVVTDHLMPDMDGVSFVREVRAFNQQVPIIVISGLPDADQEYADLNVIFRMKPCEPEELISLIRELLDGPRHRASA